MLVGRLTRQKNFELIIKAFQDLKEKELQKDLHRKEKALAEMTARIVLLKKTQLLFADEEGDE